MDGTAESRIAFIGGGNMARALIGGLLRQQHDPQHISVGEPLPAQREALQRELGVRAVADNRQAIEGASLVVLAVKPQQAALVSRGLFAATLPRTPLLLSIMAGIRTAQLQQWCPQTHVVRAMPNRPALLGAGISALFATPAVNAEERVRAERLLSSAGRVVWVQQEPHLDAVTAVSGSGPAYFFLLAEQLKAAAIALGLDAKTAELLASETLYGAGQLAHHGASLQSERAAVTSKGGTTEAALRVLGAAGLDRIVAQAVQAASERSAELADELARPL